jgi:hypothetical protein
VGEGRKISPYWRNVACGASVKKKGVHNAGSVRGSESRARGRPIRPNKEGIIIIIVSQCGKCFPIVAGIDRNFLDLSERG